MKRIVNCTMAALTLVGFSAPQSTKAELPGRANAQATTTAQRVVDVALHEGGLLVGVLLNAQSVPVAGSEVLIRRQGELVAKTKTNEHGRFVAAGLRGGGYEIVSEGSSAALRAWAPGTAPPNALQTVLVVANDNVIRGQLDGDADSTAPRGLTGDPDLDSLIIGAGFGVGIWGIIEFASSS